MCEVHKPCTNNCLPFISTLSATNGTILAPNLGQLISNETTVKNYFHFVEDIVDHDSEIYMRSCTFTFDEYHI